MYFCFCVLQLSKFSFELSTSIYGLLKVSFIAHMLTFSFILLFISMLILLGSKFIHCIFLNADCDLSCDTRQSLVKWLWMLKKVYCLIFQLQCFSSGLSLLCNRISIVTSVISLKSICTDVHILNLAYLFLNKCLYGVCFFQPFSLNLYNCF